MSAQRPGQAKRMIEAQAFFPDVQTAVEALVGLLVLANLHMDVAEAVLHHGHVGMIGAENPFA